MKYNGTWTDNIHNTTYNVTGNKTLRGCSITTSNIVFGLATRTKFGGTITTTFQMTADRLKTNCTKI